MTRSCVCVLSLSLSLSLAGALFIYFALPKSNEIVVVLTPRSVVLLLFLMLRLPTRQQCVEWLQRILLLLSHIFGLCSRMSLTRSRQLTLKWIKKRLAMTRRRERVSGKS